MARVVTQYQAFGVYRDEAITNKALQFLRLKGTAANTDTAFDLGTYAGSFWTDAILSTAGAAALLAIKDIAIRAQQYLATQGLGASARSQVSATAQVISGTVAAGSATPLVTVTGLLTTDTIRAVTQRVKGANNLPLLGWNTQIAGGITAVYSADPGAGGTLDVLFSRSIGTLTPDSGQVVVAMDGTNILLPNLTYKTTDAPTSFELLLSWVLKDGEQPVKAQS